MMTNNISVVAEAVKLMDSHLHGELLKRNGEVQSKKLWENTFIKHQLDKREQGGEFTLPDHIRAMVYSMLSSNFAWERVESGIDLATGRLTPIDEIFCQYDTDTLLQCDPVAMRDKIKVFGCAGQSTKKQMDALIHHNIGLLRRFEESSDSLDGYYQKYINEDSTLKKLVQVLSNTKSKEKMVQLDVALVSEYLRNVGYDIPKPDRHIRRILGSKILACSTEEIVPVFEAFDIVTAIAKEAGKRAAEVDYILWSYCAKGYGEICTAKNPKCGACVTKACCNTVRGV